MQAIKIEGKDPSAAALRLLETLPVGTSATLVSPLGDELDVVHLEEAVYEMRYHGSVQRGSRELAIATIEQFMTHENQTAAMLREIMTAIGKIAGVSEVTMASACLPQKPGGLLN